MQELVIPTVLISSLVVLLTEGIVSIGKQFGYDISGRAAMLAALMVGVVIAVAKTYYATLPPTEQSVVAQLVGTIATIVASYGVNDFVKGFGKPQ